VSIVTVHESGAVNYAHGCVTPVVGMARAVKVHGSASSRPKAARVVVGGGFVMCAGMKTLCSSFIAPELPHSTSPAPCVLTRVRPPAAAAGVGEREREKEEEEASAGMAVREEEEEAEEDQEDRAVAAALGTEV